jgi:molybdopterin-guanine dinucleotide biosynthesis adapter protein
MMTPSVVSIVSKKNSGKTTLIEKLIPALKRKGYRVGTVKHDTHGFDIDHQGKDTWRHKQAGADAVVISSAWKISLIKDVAEEMSLDQIVTQHFSDMDIVITEGYKRANKPQIEVFRSTAHSRPIHTKEEKNTLVAIMSDVPLDFDVPQFDINDVQALADFIEDAFLKERSSD